MPIDVEFVRDNEYIITRPNGRKHRVFLAGGGPAGAAAVRRKVRDVLEAAEQATTEAQQAEPDEDTNPSLRDHIVKMHQQQKQMLNALKSLHDRVKALEGS